MRLTALHHVTAICSDARRTVAFYRDELGLTLVKKTVNFDDPRTYHLYFGDEQGSPGSLLTFFEWPRVGRGRLGRGLVERIGLALPKRKKVEQVEDPDGLRLELQPGDAVRLTYASAFGSRELYNELIEFDSPLRFMPSGEEGVYGAGVTHHVAWRVADDEEQARWREQLLRLGLRPTEVFDRKYFRSVYVRMPDGLLLELATDGPGFAVDEPADALGKSLALPDWLEGERPELERVLIPI